MDTQIDFQDLNGTPPPLEGSVCERFLTQQFWYDHKLEEEVNVIYLKADGSWFRLYFDCGIIFWRDSHEAQIGVSSFTDGTGCENAFPIHDIGTEFGLNNLKIDHYEMNWFPEGASVTFRFVGGRLITFENFADHTSIKVEQADAGQLATRPVSKSAGSDKLQSESEGRSR